MNITSFEIEFENLLDQIANMTNGKKLLDLSGISARKLDFSKFTDSFVNRQSSNVADLTVDSNSNIKQRSMITFMNEAPKGLFRLNNYYMLWKDIKAKKGLERANEVVRADIIGDVYIADFHSWQVPYCYAFSAFEILEKGMPFINSPVSKPAVHFDSFIQHIIQSTMYYSNSIAGAVAFPDLFPALWFTYQYDKSIGYPTNDPAQFDRWVEQQFQLFAYTINQPYRSGTQSPFVNVSVMDKYFLQEMFDGMTWENPKTGEFIEIDIKGVDKLQRKFAEWFVKENDKQILTFPVMTAMTQVEEDSSGKRSVKDEEFFRWIAEINKNRALFNIFCGTQGKLSSCLSFDETIEVFEE